jgi:hypothetical protein
MLDKQGNAYANVSEIIAGSKVRVDDGFLCMKENSLHEVQLSDEEDTKGNLFIDCEHGKHFLDGQIAFDPKDKTSYYIGMYKEE